jgi:hypothetical protein
MYFITRIYRLLTTLFRSLNRTVGCRNAGFALQPMVPIDPFETFAMTSVGILELSSLSLARATAPSSAVKSMFMPKTLTLLSRRLFG